MIQSVTCLTEDACLTENPGVASSILVRPHTFMEIDHKVNSMVRLLPSPESRRVVSYMQKYGTKCLVMLAQEKVWLGEVTGDMTITVDWDVKQRNKQN